LRARLLVLHLDLVEARLSMSTRLASRRRSVSSWVSPGRAGRCAAALALEVGPAAHQARGHVLELGQLDLQLAFVRTRALGEDVEDQAGAVDDAALGELLEVALLHRRERVVDQDQVGSSRWRSSRSCSALPVPMK
jgi:hypothetical protein